jgi:uncharacterized protein
METLSVEVGLMDAFAEQPLRQIVLKVASRCNLNCSYCYIYNGEDTGYLSQPKKISDEVYGALLERLDEYVEQSRRPVAIAFHGGEPTLIGVARFRHLVQWARQALGDKLERVAIQTNGTLLDAEWARAIKELDVAPSISIDGPRSIHDASRVDLKGRGSHERVVRGIRELQSVGLQPNVLCVVNPRQNGLDVYRHLRSLNVTRMDFLLPDVSHDNFPALYGDLGSTPVADYLLPVLHAWMEEDDDDVRVRLFWELYKKLLGGHGTTDAFGSQGTSYLIVETDGSIEAMDALRVCKNGISRTGLNVLSDGFAAVSKAAPIALDVIRGALPLSPICVACPKRDVCGGGYLPSRYSQANLFSNPSVWCQDISLLIDALKGYLSADEGRSPAPQAQNREIAH